MAEIRDEYSHHKMTRQEQLRGMQKTGQDMLKRMRRNGASEALISEYASDMAYANSARENAPEDEPRVEIIKQAVTYCHQVPGGGASTKSRVTITSEGSRNWRHATNVTVDRSSTSQATTSLGDCMVRLMKRTKKILL